MHGGQDKSRQDKEEDELTMIEMKKVADRLIENIETEYDCPSLHPVLDKKVPVLELAMWVEEVKISAQGMEGWRLHSRCEDGKTCLPIGEDAHGTKQGHPGFICSAMGSENNNFDAGAYKEAAKLQERAKLQSEAEALN